MSEGERAAPRGDDSRHGELEVLRQLDRELVKSALDVDTVMASLVRGALDLTEATFCDVLTRDDPDTLQVVWASQLRLRGLRVPIRTSVTGEVYESGESRNIPDVRSYSRYHQTDSNLLSELAVPMKDEHGAVLGVVNLESSAVGHFNDRHREIVELLAGQAAIAFRNARLHNEFQKLLEASVAVQAAGDGVATTLTKIAEVSRALTGAEHCQVLLDAGTGYLAIEYSTQQGADRGADRVRIDDSVSGLALLTGRPVRIDDIRNDARARGRYKGLLGQMTSELAVPIVWRGNKLGVINLESSGPAAFKQHDEELVSLFANQAALVVLDARRVQELVWVRQIEAELYARAQEGDAYSPLIHRLNSDAGGIKADLSEIRNRFAEVLARPESAGLVDLLDSIERSADKVLEGPMALRRRLERVLQYTDVSVNDLVQDVASRYLQHPGISITEELGEDIDVVCPPQQLEDAVDNLLQNSVEVLSAGGRITVRTQPWVTNPQRGTQILNGVEISIADTCGGIPSDRLDALFQIGQVEKGSTKRRGLRFGLWWVRSFAERVGGGCRVEGRVRIDSQVGCRFTLRIPRNCRVPGDIGKLSGELGPIGEPA